MNLHPTHTLSRRLHRGSLLLMMMMCTLTTLACQVDESCYRELGPEGETIVTCPRQEPVTLEVTPEDPDADCTYDTETPSILCGSERFSLSGEKTTLEELTAHRSGDMSTDDQFADDDEHGDPLTKEDPLTGAIRIPVQSSCQIVGTQVICGDGARGELPPLTDISRTVCMSWLMPGHGQRILCTTSTGNHRDEAQHHVLVPEEGSIPEALREPTCRVDGKLISCDEGSVVIREGAQAMEVCENPRIKKADPDVVFACFEEEMCDLDLPYQAFNECLEQAMSRRTPECQEALDPPIVCGDDTTYLQQTSCVAQDGVFVFAVEEDVAFFERLSCVTLHGDVLFAPDARTPTSEVDLLLLSALKGVRIIRGSLVVEHAAILADDEDQHKQARLRFEASWKHNDLSFIGRDLVFRHVKGITHWEDPYDVEALGGGLVLSQNPDLVTIDLDRTLRDKGDPLQFTRGLQVSANPALERVLLDDRLEVEGTLVILDNNALNACKMTELWEWGVTHAEAIWIGKSIEPDDTSDTIWTSCPL